MSDRPPAGLGYCQRCATRLESRLQDNREHPTCPACGFVHYLDPKVAVAVVLTHDGGVLLGRRNVDPGRGAWSFPAGYVNRGEVLEEAALREVAEEMGVAARLAGLVGVYSARDDAVILVVYAGVVAAGEPRADGREISEVRTFPVDALPPLGFPHDQRILADWQRLVGRDA